MWISSEDARSDFILAAAATVLGGLIRSVVEDLPLYPDRGSILASLLAIAWIYAIWGLVPYLLARYRNQGFEAFGLGEGNAGLSRGFVVAAVPVIAHVLMRWPSGTGGGLAEAVLGRLGPPILGSGPAILEENASDRLVDILIAVLALVVSFIALVSLIGFLTTRARDAFRRTELSLVEALRTFGMGAAAAALVLGLLNVIGGNLDARPMLVSVAALAVLILVADTLVDTRMQTSRATVLAPAIVVMILQITRFGGIFSRGLVIGLFAAAVVGGHTLVASVLLETRSKAAWAVVPYLAALSIWPGTVFLVG